MSEREPTFSERLEMRGFANLPSLSREMREMHSYADKTLFTMPELQARYEFWQSNLMFVGPMKYSRPDLDIVVNALKFEIDMREAEGIEVEQVVEYGWSPEGSQ